MELGLIFEAILISLLILTIGFCWILNNKITSLRDSKEYMLNLVKTFDAAIIKTHKNIEDLKQLSATSHFELQSYLNKATELINDLAFMTESAVKIADRLDNNISLARHEMDRLNNIDRYPQSDILTSHNKFKDNANISLDNMPQNKTSIFEVLKAFKIKG